MPIRTARSAARAALVVLAPIFVGRAANAQGAAPPDRATLVARLDSLATAFVKDGTAAGATVAVVRGADTLLLRGYGFADTSAHRPATAATVYRIGSITKQFTAAAVLQLVEQGRVALDDTLGRWLPQYPQWARVTVRQLLNHTSGIPSYTGSAAWRAHMGETLAPAAVMAFVARDTFDFAPGTHWRYNNSGYFLLGQLLERVTGTPYAALVEQRFFRPLGMPTASYCPDAPRDRVFAAGYDRREGGYAPTTPLSMTSPYAAGALCMAVPDYLRWQAALTGGRVVRPATYARMSRSDTTSDGTPTNYGWGLAPATVGAHAAVAHGGGINGFSTEQMWLPADSLRVVVFSNTLGSDVDRLAANLAAAVVGEPLREAPKAVTAVALPAAVRDAAVGTYLLQLGPNRVPFTVRVEGGGLVAQAAGQGTFPLVYAGDDTFGAAFDPTLRLRLVREGGQAAGRVTGVRLQQGGGTFEGARQHP